MTGDPHWYTFLAYFCTGVEAGGALRPKEIIDLFPAHRLTKNKSTRAAAKIFLSEKMLFDA